MATMAIILKLPLSHCYEAISLYIRGVGIPIIMCDHINTYNNCGYY